MGFDDSADNYRTSPDHAGGDDLDTVRGWLKGRSFSRLVDVATAAGHMAAAVEADVRIGIDLSENMLKTARDTVGVIPVMSRAEALPLSSSSFDILTCRIALHHFTDPAWFFSEAHRVLRDNGVFILIDSVVDVDDAPLNRIELLRDPSHVRSRTVEDIISMAASGFRLHRYALQFKRHDFPSWVRRLGADDERAALVEQAFLGLSGAVRDVLKVEVAGGRVISYTDRKGIFFFRKGHT